MYIYYLSSIMWPIKLLAKSIIYDWIKFNLETNYDEISPHHIVKYYYYL